MIKNIYRLICTLRYITLLQIIYQVWYRIKNKFLSISWYKKYIKKILISPLKLKVDIILQNSSKEYYSKNSFTFLNISHNFGNQIDWNFNNYGKLWNYNLQYLSFLLDEDVDKQERLEHLKDFSVQLLSNKIPLEPFPVSLRINNILLYHNRYPIEDIAILSALKMQIAYLENNLEYHILANHLLENAFSLYIASIFINDLKLLKKSTRLLESQLNEQILNDGGHYESSPMYQSILLSRLMLAIDISEQSKIVSKETILNLKEFAKKMLAWINSFSFPDGSWALMNDSAIGIAPTNNQLFNAAKLLNLEVFKSNIYESGYRKLIGKNWEAIVKIGNVQPSYQPGHTHSDILSFCIWIDGKQIVVDAGTSTYSISKQRDKERSTAFHNTVTIANKNQSDVWSGFRVGNRAKVFILDNSSDTLDAVVYFQGNKSISHRRRFNFFYNKIEIIDEVQYTKNDSFDTSIGLIQLAEDVSLKHQGLDLKLNDNVLISSDALLYTDCSEYSKEFNKLIMSNKVFYYVEKTNTLTINFL